MRQYVYNCATNQKAYFIYGDYVYRLATSEPEFRISKNRWSPLKGDEAMTVRHGLVFKDSNPASPFLYVGAAKEQASVEGADEEITGAQNPRALFFLSISAGLNAWRKLIPFPEKIWV